MLEQAMARFHDVAKLSGIGLGRYRGPVMHIECRTQGASLATVPVDAGYRLSITATEVRLVAAGPAGVLRGLSTVRQLLDTSSGSVEIPARTDDRYGAPFHFGGHYKAANRRDGTRQTQHAPFAS